jgi:hypothetical protein
MIIPGQPMLVSEYIYEDGVPTDPDSITAVLYRIVNGVRSASGATVTPAATLIENVGERTFSWTNDAAWNRTDDLELVAIPVFDGVAYPMVIWRSHGHVDAVIQTAAAAAITAAGLPAATSAKIAADCALGDNGWAAAKIAIADAVWGFTVAVVDMVNVSAATVLSGVLTLLARVTGLVRTKEEDDAADAAILEAIGEIEGGGGTVNVLPAIGITADRSPGVTLQPVVGETISQSITLYATDGTTAIDLSGKTLAIVFETLQGIDVAVISSASINVSGAESNVVTFAYPSAVTSSERTLRFAIKDASAPLTMYLQGLCVVTRAPQVDI